MMKSISCGHTQKLSEAWNENNLVGFSDIQYFWNHQEKKRCLKTFKMEVCKTNPTPG